MEVYKAKQRNNSPRESNGQKYPGRLKYIGIALQCYVIRLLA